MSSYVYEVCLRDEGRWTRIPGGMAHESVVKAKEDLRKMKLRYPGAFVARVYYLPRKDGSFSRHTFGFVTPLPRSQG